MNSKKLNRGVTASLIALLIAMGFGHGRGLGFLLPVAAADDAPPAADANVLPPPPAPPSSDVPDVTSAATDKTSETPAAAQDSLAQAVESRATGRFVGKPITLQVRDADVSDVLRLISEASGFNIVMGDDVKGKLTLSMVDVPWDEALDVVLHTMKLGAERNNNLLRVVTLSNLTQEKQAEVLAKNAAMAASPKVTKIFPISYADPNALMQLIQKLGSIQASSQSGATSTPSGNATAIQVDTRTNSIVVQDVAENIAKVEKLIRILDTATPQVLIEAKVIEATEGFTKNLGGNLGFGSSATATNQFFGSFNASNPIDPLIGSPGVFTDGGKIAAGGSNQFGFSPTLTFIPGVNRLNAILNIGETENMVKVITSPKIVVLNKQAASITQSTPVALPQQTTTLGTTVNTIQILQANIGLSVTPTVTNDGSVQLQLNLQRDVPTTISGGGQAVANRNLQTQVLVDSGSTLVIGGVYTMQVNHSASGFPILRDIPILGVLFGDKADNNQRSELFFFITPRILNTKEAGLSG